MKREHREYTAFCFRNLGLFEWLVMPKGFKNLPATFTRLQEIVFSPLEWSDILKIFIDDMCVFSKTLPELKVYLDRVLKRLIWAGLKLCPSKCEFESNSVQFLGHVICDGKMTMSERKTEAIRKLLPPSNVKELQQVLGLFQYYRVFIPEFAHIARPVTKLLSKKVSFDWTAHCQKAFDFLKNALCSYPILTCYNPRFRLVLDTDYQKNAISAILGMQNPAHKKEQVIEYAS
jgi:hypothetical protein